MMGQMMVWNRTISLPTRWMSAGQYRSKRAGALEPYPSAVM